MNEVTLDTIKYGIEKNKKSSKDILEVVLQQIQRVKSLKHLLIGDSGGVVLGADQGIEAVKSEQNKTNGKLFELVALNEATDSELSSTEEALKILTSKISDLYDIVEPEPVISFSGKSGNTTNYTVSNS